MIYAPSYKLTNEKLEDIKDGVYLVTYLSIKMTKKGNMVGYFDICDDGKYKRLIAPPFLFEAFEERHFDKRFMSMIQNNEIYATIEKGRFNIWRKD